VQRIGSADGNSGAAASQGNGDLHLGGHLLNLTSQAPIHKTAAAK
jgi:hypothetical protein